MRRCFEIKIRCSELVFKRSGIVFWAFYFSFCVYTLFRCLTLHGTLNLWTGDVAPWCPRVDCYAVASLLYVPQNSNNNKKNEKNKMRWDNVSPPFTLFILSHIWICTGWLDQFSGVAFSIYMKILLVALLHNYLVIFAHAFISRVEKCHLYERRCTFRIFANMTLHSCFLVCLFLN